MLHVSLGSRRVAAGSGTWGQLCQCSGSSDKLLTFGSDKSWERTCTVLLRKARHPQALLTFEILVWFQEPLLSFALRLPLFIPKHWVWNKQTQQPACPSHHQYSHSIPKTPSIPAAPVTSSYSLCARRFLISPIPITPRKIFSPFFYFEGFYKFIQSHNLYLSIKLRKRSSWPDVCYLDFAEF